MARLKSLMDMVVGSCEETSALLSAHLEGELKGLRRLRVRMHLAGCSVCSAVLRSLRDTVERLRQLDGEVTPPPARSVVPAVLERIRALGPK
jgi:predicted anti-sigma-YlaC factor YlaD